MTKEISYFLDDDNFNEELYFSFDYIGYVPMVANTLAKPVKIACMRLFCADMYKSSFADKIA
jgi:hypothetical protein